MTEQPELFPKPGPNNPHVLTSWYRRIGKAGSKKCREVLNRTPNNSKEAK